MLFRDSEGELGLIDRACPHRGADLCYGRLEDNGLRCPFHGWHFDRTGQCVEQPGEPEGSQMHLNIKTTSYPVIEKNGIIFAYMGRWKTRAAGFPRFRLFPRTAKPCLRLQGSLGMQLAAGDGSRHRPGACVVPAPLSCRMKTRRTATASSSATRRPIPISR